MAKEKIKIDRKNFRFRPEVTKVLADSARSLNMSESYITELFLYWSLTTMNNFVICPTCGDRVAIKPLLPKEPAVAELTCVNGTKIWFDIEHNKILKHKDGVKPVKKPTKTI